MILAEILETLPTEVKYKKTQFLDGSTYVESKKEIHLIKHADGTKEELNFITLPNTNPITKNDSTKSSGIIIKDETKVENATNNNQIATNDYYRNGKTSTGLQSGKLSITKKGFQKNNTFISEKEFYEILKQTNDNQIIALIAKANKAKKNQYISFGFIIGVGSFLIYPPAFLILGPIPVITYFKFRASRKNYNIKALELYNLKTQ